MITSKMPKRLLFVHGAMTTASSWLIEIAPWNSMMRKTTDSMWATDECLVSDEEMKEILDNDELLKLFRNAENDIKDKKIRIVE